MSTYGPFSIELSCLFKHTHLRVKEPLFKYRYFGTKYCQLNVTPCIESTRSTTTHQCTVYFALLPFSHKMSIIVYVMSLICWQVVQFTTFIAIFIDIIHNQS